MTSNDLFIVGCLVLYGTALALFLHYSCQNSQPARRLVAESLVSPLVDARLNRLADAVCGPRPEGVRDVREER